MIGLLRRYQKAVFAVVAILMAGSFVGLGGSWFIGRDNEGLAARVGKTKIKAARLNLRAEQYAEALRQRGTEVDDAMMAQLRREMLNNMMVDEMLAIKADELGIKVTDAEVAGDIRATPVFQNNGQFDQDAYFRQVRAVFRQTPQEYERELRKSLKSQRVKTLIFRMARVAPGEIDAGLAAAKKQQPKEAAKITREMVAESLQRQRAVELINQCLRQLSAQVEQQVFPQNLESGA